MALIRNVARAQEYAAEYCRIHPGSAFYWRVEDVLRSSGCFDVDGDYIPGPSRVELELLPFRVLKTTPSGVRIDDYQTRVNGKGRFISRDWTKQWACPTIEEAVQSFVARKKKQRLIYSSKLRNIDEALRLVELQTDSEVVF